MASWHLRVENNSKVYLYICGRRALDRKGEEIGAVEGILVGRNDKHVLLHIQGEEHGKHMDRERYRFPLEDEDALNLEGIDSNESFIKKLCEITVVERRQRKRRRKDTQQTAKRVCLDDVRRVNEPSQTADKSSVVPYGDEGIQAKYVGTHTMNIMALLEPLDIYKIRAINYNHVRTLKKSLLAAPAAHATALPVLVDKEDIGDPKDWSPDMLSAVRIYTLGGNHLRTACHEVLTENSGVEALQCLRKISVHVFVGLSPSEARTVASLHNTQTETLRTHFLDKATHCRKVLFEMAAIEQDQETPKPSRDWKTRCQRELGETNKTLEALETTFHVAAYSKKCWRKLQALRDNDANHTSWKQTFFQDFQGISDDMRAQLLSRAASESLTKVAKEARESKKMARIKDCFLELTQTASWDEAKNTYPEHACEDLIQRKFMDMPFKHVPREFIHYCQEAVDAGDLETEILASTNDLTLNISAKVNGLVAGGPVMDKLIKKWKRSIRKDMIKNWNQIAFEQSKDGSDNWARLFVP